jgi:hypothetical protein
VAGKLAASTLNRLYDVTSELHMEAKGEEAALWLGPTKVTTFSRHRWQGG